MHNRANICYIFEKQKVQGYRCRDYNDKYKDIYKDKYIPKDKDKDKDKYKYKDKVLGSAIYKPLLLLYSPR